MSRAREHRLFAALYDRLSAAAEDGALGRKRAELLRDLRGRVVDVGAGTGANLRHYREIDHLTLVEPDGAMRRRLLARLAAAPLGFPYAVLSEAVGETPLPLADASVDAAVCTLVLCSVTNPDTALADLRRVLRPGGVLVVLEHVRSGNPLIGAIQHALTPLQCRLAAGCHLDRDTSAALARAGFDTSDVASWHVPRSLKPFTSAIAGIARRT